MSTNLAQYGPALRAVSFVLTGDRQRADGLAEKTILQLLTDPRDVPPGASLKVWMLRALHSLHFSEAGEKQPAIHPLGAAVAQSAASLGNPDVSLESVEFRRAFWRLGDDEREALFLTETSGLSREEVARVCGCTTGATETLALRARQKLQRLLPAASAATAGRRRHPAGEDARPIRSWRAGLHSFCH